MTGIAPRPGDLVHISERASIAFANAPVESFRVTEVELVDGWPGWCRIRGYDTAEIADPAAGDVHYQWHRVAVEGLTIRPGDGWST